MTPQEEFISIYKEHITRKGADELLDWLKRTDFFTAPASSRYHCACESGLVIHSVSVFNTMMEKHFDEETDSIESFAICALLHDLCKAQFYKVSTRNVKNEQTGQWEKVPYYAIDARCGSKSRRQWRSAGTWANSATRTATSSVRRTTSTRLRSSCISPTSSPPSCGKRDSHK